MLVITWVVDTWPCWSACQPWMKPPSLVVMRPSASTANEPARVYVRPSPDCTTKNPSPWMAKSVERPVRCRDPWAKLVAIDDTREPRPIVLGLVPPVVAVARPAPRNVWLSTSSKTVDDDLKPLVLTFEMLLPTTSIIVWWLRRPEMAENIERIMW